VPDLAQVAATLSAVAGAPVSIRSATPITEGWSARYGSWPWVVRCRLDGPPGWGEGSVVVKTPRPAGHSRPPGPAGRERAALTLLAELDCDAGPRLRAEGPGFLVLEDLGTGPALEDLLVGADPSAATAAFTAVAECLGRMHAATHGHEHRFAAPPGTIASRDRVSLAGRPLGEHWAALRDLPGLPGSSPAAERDLRGIVAWMSAPPLALTNGDPAPQNNRVGGDRARLLDFEDATFRHPLLDAAHLRLPFYGGPCWSRIPRAVGARVEAAYRSAAGLPDDGAYADGMAAATAAWAVLRLVRLPKLLARDDPHPLGYSRRGQLVDTLEVAVGAARAAGALPGLAGWFTAAIGGLRRRWPHLPPAQAVYPAYRGAGSSGSTCSSPS
jgi:hypothetical protein